MYRQPRLPREDELGNPVVSRLYYIVAGFLGTHSRARCRVCCFGVGFDDAVVSESCLHRHWAYHCYVYEVAELHFQTFEEAIYGKF